MWTFHKGWALQVLSRPAVSVGVRRLSYVQGQTNGKQREYFYYIDHQGQLFMDDTKVKNFVTCFKDKVFLRFFFKRLQVNKTGRYSNFPFISPCGPEMNFIRCDDQPVVFTHLVQKESGDDQLVYGGFADTLTIPFQPEKLCMLPQSGRLYHPAPERTGGIGLVKSLLAIDLSKQFRYNGVNPDKDCPTHFVMENRTVELDHSLLQLFTSNEEVEHLRTSTLKER